MRPCSPTPVTSSPPSLPPCASRGLSPPAGLLDPWGGPSPELWEEAGMVQAAAVAPSQTGLRLARDPTQPPGPERRLAAWSSGASSCSGRQFAGVSGRPLCWGSWNETRPSLRPRPQAREGVDAERRRCRGGLTLEVAEEPSGGRVSCCPEEGLAVRPRTRWEVLRRCAPGPGGRGVSPAAASRKAALRDSSAGL